MGCAMAKPITYPGACLLGFASLPDPAARHQSRNNDPATVRALMNAHEDPYARVAWTFL
jgi:hypothetical protein